jgi:hypothetical protein
MKALAHCITKCMRIADKPAVRVQTMIPTV